MSSQLKQMSTSRECSRSDERIDPRPRKRNISDVNFSEQIIVEYGMAKKYFSPPHIYFISWPLTTGKNPTQTFLGQTKPPTYWRWTIPLSNAQMGLGALGKLQMRSRGANGRSHTSFLSPVPPSK